jgi:DNA sulfur modification protein DndB
MNVSNNKNYIFPAMRSVMGDREYFISVMTFSDIKDWVKPIDEIHERKEFKTWLQRVLDPKHTEKIATYLCTQNQRFFNAIVVGIYRGELDWFPVTFDTSEKFNELEQQGANKGTLGFLKLTGDEEIFAIDGQHRVEGIKRALEMNNEVGDDQQCVIFVNHKTDDDGHKRTRRLFSTLNRYAKLVSRGDIVALSEDDSFAIVTRRLAEEYEYLKNGYAEFTRETNIPPTNKSCVTTMLALYEMVRTLAVSKSAERKKLEIGPPGESKIDQIYKDHCDFWDALRKYIPEIKEVTNVPVTEEIAGKYRRTDGGHILFRPNGQIPFAKAVRILMDAGASVSDAVEALSKVPLQLNSKPWLEVLWDESKGNVITKNSVLAQNLLLYMVGFPPGTKSPSYNLEESYQKTIGDKTVLLTSIPVVKFSITK